jgi:ribonuclease HII
MKRSQAWLADDFAPPARPDTMFEERGYRRGFKNVAGLDEVGRGPWAGPVVAAAVILPKGVTHPEIRDSKIVPAAKREVLAQWIKQEAMAWAIGVIGSEEIDRINILRASLMAMSVAFGRLEPRPDLLLIDGSHTIPLPFLIEQQNDEAIESIARQNPRPRIFAPSQTGLPRQTAIVKGDAVCLSIAAASILAKVARDQIMSELDERYPDYGFAKHKGYGSEAHADALDRFGPSPIHRRSFSPVWRAFQRSAGAAPAPLFDE